MNENEEVSQAFISDDVNTGLHPESRIKQSSGTKAIIFLNNLLGPLEKPINFVDKTVRNSSFLKVARKSISGVIDNITDRISR